MTTLFRIPDAFSGEINDLSASSAHVPGALLPSISVSLISIPNNSNITASSIYENGVVPPTSGIQPNTNSTTPSNESSLSATGAALVTCYNAASTVHDHQCGMITSSAIPNTISNVGDERVLDVNYIVPNLSDLPSEPMVALEKNPPRCDLERQTQQGVVVAKTVFLRLTHFPGVCVLKNGANKIHVEVRQNSSSTLITCLPKI